MQRIIGWIFILNCILVSTIWGIRQLNLSRDYAMWNVLPGDNCTLPCWHGLKPHLTSIQEAYEKIRADPILRLTSQSTTQLCWDILNGVFASGCANSWRGIGQENDLIEIIDLYPRDHAFLIGDAIQSFGPPVASMRACKTTNGNLYFEENVIGVTGLQQRHFGPETALVRLTYVGPQGRWYSEKTPHWQSFADEPETSRC